MAQEVAETRKWAGAVEESVVTRMVAVGARGDLNMMDGQDGVVSRMAVLRRLTIVQEGRDRCGHGEQCTVDPGPLVAPGVSLPCGPSG